VSESFEIRFGDDFTDRLKQLVDDAVSDHDISDEVSNALDNIAFEDKWDISDHVADAVGDHFRYSSIEDHFDMSDYSLSEVEGEIEKLKEVMQSLAKVLAEAGFVPEGYKKEVGQV